MRQKKKKAKQAPSPKRRGAKKPRSIGAKKPRKGASKAFRPGRAPSTSAAAKPAVDYRKVVPKAKPYRPGSDRSHLAKRPRTKPRSLTQKGRASFREDKRARVDSARKGRPPTDVLRAWCDKRKHVSHWRNRDSSFEAIVEWYGETAFNQALRAMARCPGRPYFNVVFYEKVKGVKEQGTAPERVLSGGSYSYIRPVKAPTQRGESPGSAFRLMLTLIESENPLLYMRRIGARLYWAMPAKGEES